MTSSDLRERFAAALMPNYGVPPVALTLGRGCEVYDADGRQYLDLIAGIAVSSLGHGHPALVKAIAHQAATLAHTSNLFVHEREIQLAERLIGLLGGDAKVFFGNSGTEANEAALKLVKRAAGPGRHYFVAATHGFHGRTSGALALTGKDAIREPFGPFGMDVRFVPHGDADALAEAVDEHCVAVFTEPVQGEAGVVTADDGYLAQVRRICDEADAAFVLDEIQSGIGRTGHWFAHQTEGVRPDVLTLAKGLGGGLPIGATVGFGRYADAFHKGDHGSTFGGNPVACAAALAVIDTIEEEGLLAHTSVMGDLLAEQIEGIDHSLLAGQRGVGLWRALVLTGPHAAHVQEQAAVRGFLVNAVAPDAVRLAPPLVITPEQIGVFIEALPTILDAAEAAASKESTS
ncbi:acetylornithine transaminase [Nocardiopsis sp. YSL2]|uniref:acetylornithine transaminase n=1 Tax=Nocardiopsis sp. YSL2 TaxID=2939492 RepID=UPI0026F459B9|nr:acetylornithine transaminase [Nocardiopsis sp. YSL2]